MEYYSQAYLFEDFRTFSGRAKKIKEKKYAILNKSHGLWLDFAKKTRTYMTYKTCTGHLRGCQADP